MMLDASEADEGWLKSIIGIGAILLDGDTVELLVGTPIRRSILRQNSATMLKMLLRTRELSGVVDRGAEIPSKNQEDLGTASLTNSVHVVTPVLVNSE